MEQNKEKTTLEQHSEKAAFVGELSRGKMHPITMTEERKLDA